MEGLTNTFIKGLSSDYDPQNQPTNTYRNAYNIIRRFDGSIINEKGTSLTISNLPNKEVIGSYVINNKIILLFNDEIGIVDNDIYTSKVVSNELNIQSSVQVEGRVNFKDEIIIYFVDGMNPDRCINLSSPLPTSSIDDNTRLQLNYLSPKIKDLTIDSSGGEVLSGVYQFAARLVTKTFNSTPFGLISNVLPIVDEDITVGRNKYDGALPQTPSSKSINITIDNIDTDFEYIELVVITYKGITNQLSIHTLPLIPINKQSEVNYTFYSSSQYRLELTREELQQSFSNYEVSKSIIQKDGVLVRGNLTANNSFIDLQSIANNIRVTYFINEIDYSEDVQPLHFSKGGRDIGMATTNLLDYKGEITSYKYKTYQRDEVYSFSLQVKFKGQLPISFHIDSEFTFPVTGQLTQFITTSGRKLHRLPSMEREPILNFSQTKVRVIGLKFSNIDLSSLTDKQRDSVEYIVIGRQERRDIDKTILAQGIAQRLFKSGGQELLTPLGYSGMDITYSDMSRGSIIDKASAFYSPETIIYSLPMTRGKYIKPIMKMSGTSYGIVDVRTGGREEKYTHAFLNYNRYTPIVSPVSVEIDTQYTEYIPKDDESLTPYVGLAPNSYNTREGTGYLAIWTKDNFPKYTESTNVTDLLYDEVEGTDTWWFKVNNAGRKDQDDAGYKGVTERYLYNILTNNLNPYADEQESKYIPIGVGNKDDTEIVCYGGDTFIGKFSVVSSMGEVRENIEDLGLRVRTLNYFFCESTINVNYRHYELSRDGVEGSVPYYPKTSNLWREDGTGVLQVLPSKGHSIGYNKQYSFDNNIIYYFPKQLQETFIEKYSNRIIYSLQSVEGEQLDAYRIFLPNNYHDISKHKGEITDLWVQNNILRVHTPHSLFRTFFNEQTTVVTNSGEVTLGSGGLFPRPSIEEFTSDGGYAGTLYRGYSTPFGRVWVDNYQKKLFMFSENIKEISLNGKQEYFKNNILLTQYYMGYDYSNRRLLISGEDNFTISYTPELESFSSYHNYKGKFITNNDRLFIYNNTLLEELNKGLEGNYFGETYPMLIRVVINQSPLSTKSSDNIVINSTVPLSTIKVIGVDNKESELHEIVYSNDYYFEPSLNQIVIKNKSNEYRMGVPRPNDNTRFKGKYIELEFTYNNISTINLKYITLLVRGVAR